MLLSAANARHIADSRHARSKVAFDAISKECCNKIKLHAENGRYFVLYSVPRYVFGAPTFNFAKMQDDLIAHLECLGFSAQKQRLHILVSWGARKKYMQQ
jgi:hypothetical protein